MYSDFLYIPVDESDLDYESDSVISYEESYSDSYTDSFNLGDYARSLDYSWR